MLPILNPTVKRLKQLGEIVFVGLGLNDELGMSLHGVEMVRAASHVFLELYTSLLPSFSMKCFEEISGKKAVVVSREELEEKNGETILKAAEKAKVAFVVPGDPLIATTHIALRVQAEKRGIKTRIVHGASILSAVMGLSGLHNYKFGKSVTIPFPNETSAETPYETIAQNRKLGLHTLCLLDMRAEEKRYLTIHEALETLVQIEAKRKWRTITRKTLAVGVARAGSATPAVKADFVGSLRDYDFGAPPHTLVFPGELHFMEAEALVVLAGAPKELKEACR